MGGTLQIAAFAVIAAVGIGGCEKVSFDSRWRDREVIVDGHDTEWGGARYLVDKKDVTIGIMKDDQHLYLRLSSPDRATQWKIARHGFTVWFDPDGGTGRVLGVSYPLAAEADRMRMPYNRAADPAITPDPTPAAVDSLAITIPGEKEPRRLSRAEAADTGIEAALGYDGNVLVYELKLPLARTADSPYAVDMAPSGVIGIGFVTAEVDLDAIQRERQRTERTIPGSGSGMITRPDDQRNDETRDRNLMRLRAPVPVDVWAKTRLATPPGEKP